MQDPDFLRFGAFTLDRRRRELSNAAGRITLHARAFDMLVYLIDSRDRVVPREQILAHVWSGLAVGDNNLNVQMSTLRRLLASNGGADLIITVPGQGYRFVGEVIEEPCELAAALPAAIVPVSLSIVPPVRATLRLRPPWSHAAVAAGVVLMLVLVLALRAVLAAPPPPLLSIAVLPFHDTSAAAGHGYMAEEITDDLTVDLAYIPGSTVVARQGVVLRAPKGSSRRIGRDLGVRYLVEGSIGFDGSGYTVDADLIEARTGRQMWAHRFGVSGGDIADARNRIVRLIASTLDTQLTDIVAQPGQIDRPRNAGVEDLFYRARALTWQDDTLEGLLGAQHMLEEAVRRAPGFTDALAQLSLTLVLKMESARDPDDAADLAEAEKMMARTFSHGASAVALAASARLAQSNEDCEGAERDAKAALSLEPNNLDGWAVLAKCAAAAGRLDEAAADINTTLRLNPAPGRNKPRYALLAQVELLRGHDQAAIDAAYSAISGDAPPRPGLASMERPEYVRLILMSATALSGRTEQAEHMYRQYCAVWPNRTAWRVGAFSHKILASLPGFARFLQGLTKAGMPMYAIPPYRGADVPTAAEFAAPEAVLGACMLDAVGTKDAMERGARVVDVGEGAAFPLDAGAKVALDRGAPVVDIGEGAAVIKRAWLLRAAEAVESRMDATLGDPTMDRQTQLIVMGSGAFGATTERAVRHAMALGYRDVCWFRGGEEAWFEAGFPKADLRPAS